MVLYVSFLTVMFISTLHNKLIYIYVVYLLKEVLKDCIGTTSKSAVLSTKVEFYSKREDI